MKIDLRISNSFLDIMHKNKWVPTTINNEDDR